MDKHEFLTKLYEDFQNPHSYAGVTKLYNHIRTNYDRPDITKQDVVEFLKTLDSQTLHGQVIRRYMRLPIKVSSPGLIIGVDFCDMNSFIMQFNDNYRYILVILDMFSRKVELTACRNKNTKNYLDGLKTYLRNNARLKYRKIFSDEDQAFLSKSADRFYKTNNLVRYNVKNRKFKNSIVERYIKTMKQYLFRYFTHNNTYRFIDILNSFQKKYNSTPHRGLCYKTPDEVHSLTNINEIKCQEHDQMIRKIRNYGSHIINKEIKILNSSNLILEPGTYVRLLLNDAERLFAKTSSEKIYTTEIFQIFRVDERVPVTYFLKDLNGEKIDGVVYRSEIKPVSLPNVYTVEKILKTKIDKATGKQIYFVKWTGYDSSHNSWVDSIMKV